MTDILNRAKSTAPRNMSLNIVIIRDYYIIRQINEILITIFSCQNPKFLEKVLLNYVLNFLTTTFAYFCLQCSTMFTNLTNVTSFYSSNSSTDFKTIFNRCNVKKGLKNILFSYKVGFCIYCGDLAAIVDAILDPEKRSTPINQDF